MAAPTAHRRRGGGDWFTVAVAGLVVAGLAVAGVRIVGRFGDEPGFRAPEPALESLGVPTAAFLDRWNAAVDTDAGRVRLQPPAFERDEAIELDVASQAVGTWAVVELYRTPSGEMASVLLVGAPTADDELAAFHATTVAAVVAATGRTVEDVEARVARDLGTTAVGGALGASTLRLDGVLVEVSRTAASTQLTITVG